MFLFSILYAIVETRATLTRIRTYHHVCFYFVANGRLAQLARAPPLHGGCRGFESLIAHFLLFIYLFLFIFCLYLVFYLFLFYFTLQLGNLSAPRPEPIAFNAL